MICLAPIDRTRFRASRKLVTNWVSEMVYIASLVPIAITARSQPTRVFVKICNCVLSDAVLRPPVPKFTLLAPSVCPSPDEIESPNKQAE